MNHIEASGVGCGRVTARPCHAILLRLRLLVWPGATSTKKRRLFATQGRAMDRIQVEDTPADLWKAQLNATCNRLSTQYLSLLRSASSAAALQEHGATGGDLSAISHDPRSGGGVNAGTDRTTATAGGRCIAERIAGQACRPQSLCGVGEFT